MTNKTLPTLATITLFAMTGTAIAAGGDSAKGPDGYDGDVADKLANPNAVVSQPADAPQQNFQSGNEVYRTQPGDNRNAEAPVQLSNVPEDVRNLAMGTGIDDLVTAFRGSNAYILEGWDRNEWVTVRIDADTETIVGEPSRVPADS